MVDFEIDMNWSKERMPRIISLLQKQYNNCNFKRKDNGEEIDKELSTDLIVEQPDKTECWAVKLRREEYKGFDDVTIEYMNGNGTRGDWFRFKGGVVHKYIYGYCNNSIILYVVDIRSINRMIKY